jgi:ABC-type multidrug transport system ATPase subunit
MYEGIIETLIKFFAIVTDYGKESAVSDAESLVESYLKENFSKEMVEKYMELYKENVHYYHVQHREIIYGDYGEGERIINREYLNKMCDSIVELFDLESRYMIVVQLLNFIYKPEEDVTHELRILDVIAEGLKVQVDEYNDLKTFYLDSIGKVNHKEQLFVVNGNESYHDPDIKHLYREKQRVELEIIRIRSINTLFFKYWGPRNMYLNGHRLSQDRLYVFPTGGILRTSRIIPIYYSSIMSRFIRQQGKPIIVYEAKNIEYKFSKKVYGLHPLSFQERSGDLVGIMGGSGVGKTTLLNVLNGKLKPRQGQITINGYDIHDSATEEQLKGVIGYVPQDDLLIEELTVYQNLKFNARLCFGNMNEGEIEKIIEKALFDFDLVEARDLIVGSPLKKILSGGQRKRLNIALELMREPSVLFVDEPTSGLSSSDSEKVMYLLKRQCLKGKLVIANIHQPSSDIYKLFDRMIVMDKGGRVVFFGNPMEAVTYFKNEANYVNPDESECMTCGSVKTEQPLRIIEERMVDPFGRSIRKRKISPEDWYIRYKEKVEPRVVDFMKQNPVESKIIPDNYFKIPKWFEQMRLYFKRDFATKRSNRQYLSIALLEAPLLALILGFFSKYTPTGEYIFGSNDNIPAFLFMSVVVAMFIGLSISAEEIFKDRRILKREEFLDLSRGAYFTSKILILFAISAVQVLLFVLIGYYMLGFKGLMFTNWAILFTTACFANLLGLNLSAGLNSAVAIYILIPLLLVPQLLLSGVIVDFNKMHPSMSSYSRTPIIGDLMTSRWSYEALSVNEFANNEYRENFFELEREKNTYGFKAFYWSSEVEKYSNYFEKAKDEDEKDEYRLILEAALPDIRDVAEIPSDSMQKINSHLDEGGSLAVYRYYLSKAYDFFKQGHSDVTSKLDNKYAAMLQRFDGDTDALSRYRDQHVNKTLERIVRDKFSLQKIRLIDHRIVQGDEPIFRAPFYHNGSAHFYASYKQIGNLKIDTVWFNIIVMWIFTVLMMMSLYFNLLRKSLAYIENWRLLQLSKLRDKIFYNPTAFSNKKSKK